MCHIAPASAPRRLHFLGLHFPASPLSQTPDAYCVSTCFVLVNHSVALFTFFFFLTILPCSIVFSPLHCQVIGLLPLHLIPLFATLLSRAVPDHEPWITFWIGCELCKYSILHFHPTFGLVFLSIYCDDHGIITSEV